ncbi:DUF6688 domain-containing protein [Cohnella zeiphila]|uniref:Uncharacterized protein n=1 Tax=Cohnella zeiphila TaxID=2761120 RepID=A0A7X0ST33_9BACL|nr:DUF6688 family protein [Cohnella zeiphila]MBB6735617.1 hypothetical protein [Cohnella zeiphila]
MSMVFYIPFAFLLLIALFRTALAFAGKRETVAEDGARGQAMDGIIMLFAAFLMIAGFLIDLQGVRGGVPLDVYKGIGRPLTSYASLARKHIAVIIVDWLLGLFAYWALRGYREKVPPILYAGCHALLALDIAWTAVYLVHTGILHYEEKILSVPFLQAGSIAFSLLYVAQLKRSLDVWILSRKEEAAKTLSPWIRILHRMTLRYRALPLLWTLLLFPVQLLVQLFLVLFGQRPDSVVRAFLETSGFELSRLPAPPPHIVSGDGHYLCTAAARGHRRLVKPVRAGIRHGELIPINRQLMIANAFENVLEQIMPRGHRTIRRLYDKYGYPLSRHIRTKAAADAVYAAMKPLEWLFLLVLYTVDARPENRIHLQYSGLGKMRLPGNLSDGRRSMNGAVFANSVAACISNETYASYLDEMNGFANLTNRAGLIGRKTEQKSVERDK